MKKQISFLLKKTKILTLFIIISVALLQTNCNKGKVKIYGIIDTIENCSLPYIVYFYPDAEYGNGETEFTWDFGDGEITHDRTPVHLYSRQGNYHVTLTIRNKDAQESKSIMLDLSEESIPIIPDWDFEPVGNEIFWAPARFKFFNKSQHATSVFWDFDTGDYSNIKNPEYEFVEVGNYNIRLGAICNGDTVIDAETFSILPPPSDILVNSITVWLPDSYKETNVFCVVWFAGYEEEVSPVAGNVSSFPVVFSIYENLYNFHGNFNSSALEFEIWTSKNTEYPAKIFSIQARDLQYDYYPNLISFDDGYGFALSAELEYRN